MRAPILYTASSTAYNPAGDPGSTGGRRWGDFSYTSLDPSDDMTMWTIQEFCNAANTYAVQVVKLLAPAPATPSSCSPSSVTNGVSSINVLLTGTSDGATGFFDPGPGFSNRISASISGTGVTVNGVTYTDLTHLTLNLSVASGAAGGARTVSVTNPDGQSAMSSSAILTVVGTGNSPPVLTAISNKTIDELTTLTFTNTATDPDGDALSFNLDSGPTGATVNATSGVFTWMPTEAQGPGTYDLTISVKDNGVPPLGNSTSFNVSVVSRPVIQSITHSNDLVTITWSAIANQTYLVQYKDDLGAVGWNDLLPEVTASGPTATKTSAATVGQRFYRVRLSP